tara:strand:- start:868 stop:2544 length:1677 start_codon:yes stop_codon:yes gene_type:complete
MSDLNKDLADKFYNLLHNKQYERLQFEVDMLGSIKEQHSLVKFYYASSIFLKDTSKEKELLLASDLFEEVHISNKNHLQSLYNMIAVSFKTKVFRKVLPLTLKAFEKNPDDVKLIEGLARINFFLGNRKESIQLFRQLYKMFPDKIEGRFPFVSSLNYSSGISQEEYLKECLEFSSLVEKKFKIENDNFKFSNKINDKIKVAFISADFRTHSVSHFLKGLLKRINKSNFEIILISNLKVLEQDDLSRQLMKLASGWHDVAEYSDNDLVIFLRSLNLDILFDLSGFTSGNRFEVIARRCAKVQIEWLGYNNTLGIKNMDYLIADKNLINKDEFNLYKEKILFLPKIWNVFAPPEILPDIELKEKNNNTVFKFCSFNNYQKISNRTVNVWSEILKHKNSQLLLKTSHAGDIDDLKDNILDKFMNNGVSRDQIIFLNREKNIHDHLKLYNKANIALDTFPYPGVTTSFEAIMMGVPVLTMKGFNMNSRCGESINKNIKMDHLIAENDDDYIKKAISLIKEKNNLEIYGKSLREKAISSPLFDAETFAKDFENLLKQVVENY